MANRKGSPYSSYFFLVTPLMRRNADFLLGQCSAIALITLSENILFSVVRFSSANVFRTPLSTSNKSFALFSFDSLKIGRDFSFRNSSASLFASLLRMVSWNSSHHPSGSKKYLS